VVFEVVASPPRQALVALRGAYESDRVQLFGDRLHVHVAGDEEHGKIASVLTSAGCEVRNIRRILPSLEDVFIEKLAASRRQEQAGVQA